jgi:L-alanine-DL-glutamate epimerase-like enolase superfamily enzyme
MRDLDKGGRFLAGKQDLSMSDLYDLDEMEINTVSKAALTAAGLHYISDKQQAYPWALMDLDEPGDIRTSLTVGIDRPEAMLEEINKSQFPTIKLKMGFENDENLIPAMKNIAGKTFRIDANGGWKPEKAEKMIALLSEVGVEIVEQPTSIEYIKDWKYIKGRSKAILILDEGLNSIADYNQYSGLVDGVNIKMAKSGGIIEAKRIALQARRDKAKVMLGCMVESSIGISPAAYLSPLADYFDLDGPILLREDAASGLHYDLDEIRVDENIIGGPKLKREYINYEMH